MAAAVTLTPAAERRPVATLFEISEHLTALLDTLEMVDTPEERTAIEQDIAAAMEAEVRKVDGVAQYLALCEHQQESAKLEINRLKARQQAFARKQQQLEFYVQRVLETLDKPKLEGRYNTLSLRKCPASVEVTNQADVPTEYVTVVVEESVDKRKCKAALEAGAEIPGVRLVTDRKSVVRK